MIVLLSTGSLACYQNVPVYNSSNAKWEKQEEERKGGIWALKCLSHALFMLFISQDQMLFWKNSMTGSAREISEVEYEQQTFSGREKTIKPSPNLKQKVSLRNIKDQCCGTVKCRPESIILFLQQGVIKLLSDPRLKSNFPNVVAEHRSPPFLEQHSSEWGTAWINLCRNSEFQLLEQHFVLFG